MPYHPIDTTPCYKAPRDQGNPQSRMTFMEAMY